MKKSKKTLTLILAFLFPTLTQANPAAGSIAKGVVKDWFKSAIYDTGKYVLTRKDPNHQAVLTTYGEKVLMDTCETHEKGWYAQDLVYDYRTVKNGYRSDPQTTNLNKPTSEHRIYPANYHFHHLQVFEYDSETREFVKNHKRAKGVWFEPDRYIDHDDLFVIWAVARQSNATWRVFSKYSMKNGPDDRLRKPGKYQ